MMAAADPGFAKEAPAEIQQVLEAHVFRAIEQTSVHMVIIAYTLSRFN
jgi:hypothetical protein